MASGIFFLSSENKSKMRKESLTAQNMAQNAPVMFKNPTHPFVATTVTFISRGKTYT